MSLFFSGKCGSDPVLEIVARAVNKNTKDIEELNKELDNKVATVESTIATNTSNIASNSRAIQEVENTVEANLKKVDIRTVQYSEETGKYYLPGAPENLDAYAYANDTDPSKVTTKSLMYLRVKNPDTNKVELCGPIVVKGNKMQACSDNLVCTMSNSGSDSDNEVTIEKRVILTETDMANISKIRSAVADLIIKVSSLLETEPGAAGQDKTIETDTGTKTIKIGDVNGNGEVDIADVIKLASYVMGDPGDNFVVEAADVNQDGEIDISDVVSLAQVVRGE